MNKSIRLLGLLPLLSVALAAQDATVTELLKHGEKYDGKSVHVVGPVVKFEQRTSRAGNSYFVFKLGTEKQYVSVYGKDKLAMAPKEGGKVEIIGEFKRERRVGDRTYKNEIEVTKKLDKTFGVKLLG